MLVDFRTANLTQACYLFASGSELKDVDRTDRENVVFIFEQLDPLLLAAFRTSTAMVNVHAYESARTELLNRLKGRV